MKPSKGYYCVIQYCPDLGRLEAANVGVLLFCPESGVLMARTSPSNRRINTFFGAQGHDWARINEFKKGLKERLEVEHDEIRTLADLERFIAQRANVLQITAPRPMRVEAPEVELDRLYDELVESDVRREERPPLKEKFAERFRQANLERKIRRDIAVHVPILEREVQFDFGFQNGRFNLIQSVRFPDDETSAVAAALGFGVEGKSLFDQENERLGKMQLIVLGTFRQKNEEAVRPTREILTQNGVRLIPAWEFEGLIQEIARTGKDLALAP